MAYASPSADASTASDQGRLLLRVLIGVLILLHGIAKIGSGPGPIQGLLRSHDLPGILAWGVYVGEVAAPLLLIAGIWTRAAALVIVVFMLFAVGLAHMGDLGKLTKTGGWALELQAMYLFGALAVALLGAGRFSLGGRIGRWN